MTPKISLFFVVAALFSSCVFAQEPLKFQIKNVRIGMTREEVAAKLTGLTTDDKLSEKAVGVEVAKAADDAPPNQLTLTFLDGVLIRMIGDYTNPEVDRIGGSEVILVKLRERLGPCHTVMQNTKPIANGYVVLYGGWNFKDLNRYFSFSTEKNNGVLSSHIIAGDSVGLNALRDRQKKSANAGF